MFVIANHSFVTITLTAQFADRLGSWLMAGLDVWLVPVYHEDYGAVFLVSARTGYLGFVCCYVCALDMGTRFLPRASVRLSDDDDLWSIDYGAAPRAPSSPSQRDV